MNFSKKQKIAIIISIWLFFMWIVAISLIMRVDFKGNIYSCIKFSIAGMLLAIFFYILIFFDRYSVSKFMREEEDVKKIKSMKRRAYITLIYVDIIGSFFMALLALLIDGKNWRLPPANAFAMITFAAILLTVIIEQKKIRNASKAFILQEQNREVQEGVQETSR
ncbi:MAG: hypothetical protein HDT32_04540 [Clostridiales bacterium]|nr:hypothetical protein [Clostridiales bacterium]